MILPASRSIFTYRSVFGFFTWTMSFLDSKFYAPLLRLNPAPPGSDFPGCQGLSSWIGFIVDRLARLCGLALNLPS